MAITDISDFTGPLSGDKAIQQKSQIILAVEMLLPLPHRQRKSQQYKMLHLNEQVLCDPVWGSAAVL